MRPTILICLLVVFGYIANAQFTILPQVGFENSRTPIQFNDHSSTSPLGTSFLPQVAIRLDYKNKQGYGPFLGIGTSRSMVKLEFSDPQAGMNSYTASKGNTQLRLEGGYQVTTKPIYFKKASFTTRSSTERKTCGNYMARNSCGSKLKKATAAKGSWMRIQPSLGVAYTPFTTSSEIDTKSMGSQTSYVYNAGNQRAALVSGIGFEFGNNQQRKLLLSINYIKGLGNPDVSITTPGNKPTITNLRSDASGWNFKVGIPISLNKKKAVAVKQEIIKRNYNSEYNCERFRCGQYRMNCRKVI